MQVADANGELTFRTIFPGCYAGRYPHLHFEVYPSLDLATLYTNRVLTSQIALPATVCDSVYALDAHAQSASNYSRTSLSSDGIFGDNSAAQMAVVAPSLGGDTVARLRRHAHDRRAGHLKPSRSISPWALARLAPPPGAPFFYSVTVTFLSRNRVTVT